MKEAIFHNDVLKVLRSCHPEVRKKIGDLIKDLQDGFSLKMPDSRPFDSIRKGVFELRVKGKDGSYRVFYFTKIKEVIIVFHMFKKKSQKTPKNEISSAKARLGEILEVLNEK